MSVRLFHLNDDEFYSCIASERKPYPELIGLVIKEGFIANTAVEPVSYFESVRDKVQSGLVPMMRITRATLVNERAWYNQHVGKLYELHQYIVDTRNGYVGYIVKSGDDGTKGGYRLVNGSYLGKGYDYVRSSCCRFVMD